MSDAIEPFPDPFMIAGSVKDDGNLARLRLDYTAKVYAHLDDEEVARIVAAVEGVHFRERSLRQVAEQQLHEATHRYAELEQAAAAALVELEAGEDVGKELTDRLRKALLGS